MNGTVEKRRSDEPFAPEAQRHLRKPKKPLPLPFPISDELDPPDKRVVSPSIIPDDERPFYNRIQALRPRFHKQLKRIWDKYKRDFLQTIPIEKAFTAKQNRLADNMLREMEGVANVGFSEGVRIGNDYFEDQFGVKGISATRQRRIVNSELRTFRTKSRALFVDDAELLLGQNPSDQTESILTGFDRFLLGYANVAASLAYELFTRDID